MMTEFKHIPIMAEDVIRELAIRPDGIYVDGTLGGGGHAALICEALGPSGRLIGLDQDEDAIRAASARLAPYEDRVVIRRSNYRDFKSVLDALEIRNVSGILLDLGVSSWQFDSAERGFSYRMDAPLDMRMDQRQALDAAQVVNTYAESELVRILRDYGEERFAGRIADRIVRERAQKPIETTLELAELVRSAIPAKFRQTGGHPAKRTFQAIRIEVNRELDVLQESLDSMIDILEPGGRLCVITFHSLEDRIVKQVFKTAQNPCICPPHFPVCTCGRVSKGRVVTGKPIVPGEQELEVNPRSASAKLRVFEKQL